MDKKHNELNDDSIFKLCIKYFVPTFIGSVVVVLYNIVDRFFVGKISEKALAGAGVAFYIVMIFIAFAMLVGVGSGAVVSIRLGQKKGEEAEKILGNTITIFAILGIVLYILMMINLDTILLYSGANAETLPYAKTYLEIIMYAILPLFFSYGLTNVLNAAGKFPIKINLFGYKLEETSSLKLKLRNMKLSCPVVKDILSIGMSPFLLQMASSLVGLVTNKIVETNGGTYGVAVMTIINSYLPVMTMTVYSVAQAIQPIIGFNYGAENYRRVRKALLIAVAMGLFSAAIFWIVVMLIPRELILFFNEKSTVEGLYEGIKALRIYFSLVIPASLGIIIPNYYQSTGRPRYAVILNLLRQVVIFLLVMVIFSRIWKLDGVWYAQPFTDLLFAIVLLIFLYIELRKLKRKEEDSKKLDK